MRIGCDYTAVQTANTKLNGAISDYGTFESTYNSLKSDIPANWEGEEADACLTTLEEATADVTKLKNLLTEMEQWITTLKKNFEENEAAGRQFYTSMRG